MASIKELKIKIRSLSSTNKITTAMKLVATSKLGRAKEAMRKNQAYNKKLNEVVQRVLSTDKVNDPLLEKRPIHTIRYYIYSSDKGMCGSFNNSVIKKANSIIQERAKEANIEVYCIGKRIFNFFNKQNLYTVINNDEITNKPSFNKILPLANKAIEDFRKEKIDEVNLIFNNYESVLTQTPILTKILPMTLTKEKNKINNIDYIYEPDAASLLKSLLPKTVNSLFFQALLENSVGEHSARMTAMDSATENSKDLINKYTLIMNRARQAAITTELTEIVAGAESLKG